MSEKGLGEMQIGTKKLGSDKLSPEDREFIRNELARLAGWIRENHPELNYATIREVVAELVTVSV